MIDQKDIDAEYRKKVAEAEATRSIERFVISGEENYRLKLHIAFLEHQAETYQFILGRYAAMQPPPPIYSDELHKTVDQARRV